MTDFVFVLVDDETASQNAEGPVNLKCAAAEFDTVADAAANYLQDTLGLEVLAKVADKVVFDEVNHTAFLRHATPTIHGIYIFPATREECADDNIVKLLEKYFPEDFGDPPSVH